MKQFFLGIALLLCCYSNGFGQFQIHPDSSFYTFIDSFTPTIKKIAQRAVYITKCAEIIKCGELDYLQQVG